MNLPEKFELQMKKLLGEEYDLYADSFSHKAVRALRVNEAKISVDGFLQLWHKYYGQALAPVSWTKNGFYAPESAVLSMSPLYFAGLYYIQDPAAMAPAAMLPVSAGDRVLDLCAAPGGKTTELGAKLLLAEREKGTAGGILYANDISAGRAAALRKNVERFGLTNAYITIENPGKLAAHFPDYFDKILVDAPCSGEGMFAAAPEMRRYWEEKGPDYYAPMQEEILEKAAAMLAPGGMLLYSTCTYSFAEDEGQVARLIANHPELSLVSLPEDAHFSHLAYPDGTQSRCVRLYPHKTHGGGQFMALLRKMGKREKRKASAADRTGRRDRAAGMDGRQKGKFQKSGEIYLPPEGTGPVPGIRYALTGLHLGKMKNGIFRPSQGYAMSLSAGEWPDEISLCADDARVIKYLKGETIEITPKESTGMLTKQADTLVTVDGFPLGFGRRNKSLLKNGLNPGWRML